VSLAKVARGWFAFFDPKAPNVEQFFVPCQNQGVFLRLTCAQPLNRRTASGRNAAHAMLHLRY
jgi:hypothetical protein